MSRYNVIIATLSVALMVSCAEKSQVAEREPLHSAVPVIEKDESAAQAHKIEAEDMALKGAKPATPARSIAPESRAILYDAQQLGHLPGTPAMNYVGPQPDREQYSHRDENRFLLVQEQPVSTFSIDVDSASYTNVRRMLNAGQLPPADAVRTEEFINYFGYDYPAPENRDQPFSVTTEIAPSPWSKDRYLLHIGLQGYKVPTKNIPPSNLVFLLDVSGSMNAPNKLPLLKQSMKLLARQLRDQDRVSIVVYAGASGVVLEPVKGSDWHRIEAALDQLQAGGSTNGAAGIELAYSLARSAFIEGGINRVMLATDGDFNVGTTSLEALKELVKKQRDSGIELTTLGFGMGNYNDALMNELADIGNGNSSYIDNALEANKALVTELSSTLFTIAKDVKIQIEFSPAVAEYRLIGYESRLLNREDFNNDKKDAGEIGAGHSVTALYEIVLTDSGNRSVDPLRYNHAGSAAKIEKSAELAYLKLRYKLPGAEKSRLLQYPVYQRDIKTLEKSSANFRWSAAAAGFAQLLANSEWVADLNYDRVLDMARNSRGADPDGYRAEMLKLVKMADLLTGQRDVARVRPGPDSRG